MKQRLAWNSGKWHRPAYRPVSVLWDTLLAMRMALIHAKRCFISPPVLCVQYTAHGRITTLARTLLPLTSSLAVAPRIIRALDRPHSWNICRYSSCYPEHWWDMAILCRLVPAERVYAGAATHLASPLNNSLCCLFLFHFLPPPSLSSQDDWDFEKFSVLRPNEWNSSESSFPLSKRLSDVNYVAFSMRCRQKDGLDQNAVQFPSSHNYSDSRYCFLFQCEVILHHSNRFLRLKTNPTTWINGKFFESSSYPRPVDVRRSQGFVRLIDWLIGPILRWIHTRQSCQFLSPPVLHLRLDFFPGNRF